MTRTVDIDIVCDTLSEEIETYGVAVDHRPDLPKPFNAPMQEWVQATYKDLQKGEKQDAAAEMEYEPGRDVVAFRAK